MTKLALLIPLAGCVAAPAGDVVGPFTGDVHRYAVDRIALPMTNDEARAAGDDLDGDGVIDDQIGQVVATLRGENDASTHAADMIGSGAIASFVEIQADHLDDDASVGVTYFGSDGDPATIVGGRFAAGSFRSNRTATTRVPGRAIVRIPVLADADPLAVPFEGLEIDLRPDGNGGFDGWVRGGVPSDAALGAATDGLAQMIAANPADHLLLARTLDLDLDGKLTHDEIAKNPLVVSLLSPDIQLFDHGTYAPDTTRPNPDSVSAAFTIHLSPCPDGACAPVPADRCHDRILDGDETDVDCGGSCGACPDAAACSIPSDCQSGGCDAGHCRASTCSDGVRDGLEADLDCGVGCAATCGVGQNCGIDKDCASGHCYGSFTVGMCVAGP